VNHNSFIGFCDRSASSAGCFA